MNLKKSSKVLVALITVIALTFSVVGVFAAEANKVSSVTVNVLDAEDGVVATYNNPAETIYVNADQKLNVVVTFSSAIIGSYMSYAQDAESLTDANVQYAYQMEEEDTEMNITYSLRGLEATDYDAYIGYEGYKGTEPAYKFSYSIAEGVIALTPIDNKFGIDATNRNITYSITGYDGEDIETDLDTVTFNGVALDETDYEVKDASGSDPAILTIFGSYLGGLGLEDGESYPVTLGSSAAGYAPGSSVAIGVATFQYAKVRHLRAGAPGAMDGEVIEEVYKNKIVSDEGGDNVTISLKPVPSALSKKGTSVVADGGYFKKFVVNETDEYSLDPEDTGRYVEAGNITVAKTDEVDTEWFEPESGTEDTDYVSSVKAQRVQWVDNSGTHYGIRFLAMVVGDNGADLNAKLSKAGFVISDIALNPTAEAGFTKANVTRAYTKIKALNGTEASYITADAFKAKAGFNSKMFAIIYAIKEVTPDKFDKVYYASTVVDEREDGARRYGASKAASYNILALWDSEGSY